MWSSYELRHLSEEDWNSGRIQSNATSAPASMQALASDAPMIDLAACAKRLVSLMTEVLLQLGYVALGTRYETPDVQCKHSGFVMQSCLVFVEN